MNNKKYNLSNFFETLKSDANFNTLKERIGNNTALSIKTKDGKKINIYSVEMFYLLNSNDYKDEGLIDSYLLGYKKGNKFIKQKNKRALKGGLFQSCPEKYIDELKILYFNEAPNEVFGYKQIATGKPLTLKIELIEKIGFASGVINAIDLMKEENTAFFLGFDDENNEPPQQAKNIKTDEVFEFENNFDSVKNTKVYEYFKTKLVDKKYLTIDNLHNYLKVAFENPKQPPLTKFSFEKKYFIKDIRKIFYDYFTSINTENYSTQDKYIKLLTDYFEGFDFEKIKNNFNK